MWQLMEVGAWVSVGVNVNCMCESLHMHNSCISEFTLTNHTLSRKPKKVFWAKLFLGTLFTRSNINF
jgi:hypothetical protein